MKRMAMALGVTAVALWSTTLFAQGRNFSGSWTLDAERTAAANPSSGGGGMAGGGAVAARTTAGGGGGGGAMVGGGGMAAGGGGAVAARTTAGGGGAVMAAGAGGGGGRGGSSAMTIAIDATTFTIGSGASSTPYRLDGSTTTIESARGTIVAKAAWKGDKLVIESTSQGANGPTTSVVTWYLDADALVRETSVPAPDGAQPTVRKTYYKKAQ